MQTDDVVRLIVRALLEHITDREEKLALMRIEVSNLHLHIRELRDASERETKE
jgi:hypothetical protein